MKNILEIIIGLPKNIVSIAPLLEQYKISNWGDKQSGTKIFPNGSMYITVKDSDNGSYKWIYFTKIKKEGVRLLSELILNEFSLIVHEGLANNNSQNILIWKSFLNGKMHKVRVASGLYSNLPPVFQKIDNLINQYMYKINEKVKNDN